MTFDNDLDIDTEPKFAPGINEPESSSVSTGLNSDGTTCSEFQRLCDSLGLLVDELTNNRVTVGSSGWPTSPDIELVDFIDLEDHMNISVARKEWIACKDAGKRNCYVDAIMALPGREDVKELFLEVFNRVTNLTDPTRDITKEDYSIVILARPGLGGPAVASLYARLLVSLGVVSYNGIDYLGANDLKYSREFESIGNDAKGLTNYSDESSFVFHLDQPLRLNRRPCRPRIPTNEMSNPPQCVMIKHVGSIDDISSGLQAMNRVYGHYNPVMIFEGYIPGMIYSNNENTDIELTHIPILRLPDFTPAELVVMAKAEIRRCCKSTIVFSTDIDHCAWLTFCLEGPTRSNRSQEVPNLDTIRAKVSNALCRQQIRIRSERRKVLKIKQAAWINPNLITKTDLLGSRAPLSVASSPAWRMLEQMVGQGMQDVRDTLLSLIENENQNNARALRYEKPLIISRDRIFMGPPGSGKTTAALLYGQVLSELGFFPNRIVKLVSATSLISKYEDDTTSNTNKLLKETRDGVLILDDLHRIDLGEGQFLGAALLTALLSSAQSSTRYGGPRGNGCILLVGDADSMEDLYQNAESGLRANYPLETAVKLRDFTSNELKQVLAINIQERKISLSEDAWNIALQTLEKARCRPAFGNGHAVRQLLDESLLRYYKRNAQAERGGDIVYLAGAVPEPPPLQPEDLDPSYNRLDNAHSNFSLLFHGLVDFEPIVTIFQDYAYTASGMKLRGIDPRAYIPFTFVFKGPPGTGKTSSARKLGQIFYDLGFLSSPDVVECSASNLVAKWVGHTGPLVIRQMEKALGRVLFIDEAYRLATTQGHESFQDEAISELVDAITKPKFARKLVIVLAGYSEEMNALMSSNPGLRSRFATEIRFLPLSPKGCLEYLRKCVGKVGIQLDGLDPLPAPASLSQIEVTMMRLSASKNWASGRSIESIAERIMAKVFKRCAIENDATGPMIVTAEELSTLLDDILKENSGQRRAHTSQAGYHLGDTQYIL